MTFDTHLTRKEKHVDMSQAGTEPTSPRDHSRLKTYSLPCYQYRTMNTVL